MNMTEQVPMEYNVKYFAYMPLSGIAEPYERFIFSFLGMPHIDFQSSLQTQQQ